MDVNPDLQRHITNVVDTPSRDVQVAEAVAYLLALLDRAGVEYIVVGSTAVQAHLGVAQRVPTDCDVTLSEASIDTIKRLCEADANLRFEPHAIASRVHYREQYALHLIPDHMRYVDKIDGKVFARVNVFHTDRTVWRTFTLPTAPAPIRVRVPEVEFMFCFNLCPPFDANTLADTMALLRAFSLRPQIMKEFVERMPILGRVVEARFPALSRVLEKSHPDLAASARELYAQIYATEHIE